MRSRCEKKGFADGRSRGRFRMIAEAKASGAEVGRGEDKIERFKQFLLFVNLFATLHQAEVATILARGKELRSDV